MNLSSHRRPGLKRQLPELSIEPIARPKCVSQKIRFEILKKRAVNAHMDVSSTIGDRVASKFDRHLAAVRDSLSFSAFLDGKKKLVHPMCRGKREEAPVSQVLNICVAGSFSPSS